jgi:hypothetical protein
MKSYGHPIYIFRMTLQVNLCGLIFLYIPENKRYGTYFILSIISACLISVQTFKAGFCKCIVCHHWLLCVMLSCPCNTFTVNNICLSIPGLHCPARREYFSFSPVDVLRLKTFLDHVTSLEELQYIYLCSKPVFHNLCT